LERADLSAPSIGTKSGDKSLHSKWPEDAQAATNHYHIAGYMNAEQGLPQTEIISSGPARQII
jgi:hypothetical protein